MNLSTIAINAGPILIATLVFIIALLWFYHKWTSGASARRIKRNRNSGRKGEENAMKWLKKRGYKVTEQVSVPEFYTVDGSKKEFDIRPDIFATKGKEKWVIEVKTGGAASTANRSTRRQLREYSAYFPGYQLGLIDGGSSHIKLQKIEFPPLPVMYKMPFKTLVFLWLSGVITGIILAVYIGSKLT